MSGGPPVAPGPGQISPDGAWRWDGTQWVPTGAFRAQPRGGTPAWVWWLAGGCVVLVLIAAGGLVAGGVALYNAAKSGGFNCLPSDFPVYSRASFEGFNITYVGNRKTCNQEYATSDSSDAVLAFYREALSQNPWEVTGDGGQNNEIDFDNAQTYAIGHVVVGPGQGHTLITVHYESG